MKILDITPITDTAQQPIKKGTLQFLQDAYKEIVASVNQWLIGASYDQTKLYVMYGCTNSGTGTNYIIAAGAILYGGEIYQVDAASFSATGSNVPGFVLNVTQYTTDADPVTFTDASVNNVHNIRKLSAQAVPNTDPLLYSDVVFLKSIPAAILVETNRALAIETILLNNLTLLNAAWQLSNPSVDSIANGSSFTATAPNGFYWSITNGKTTHVRYRYLVTATATGDVQLIFSFPLGLVGAPPQVTASLEFSQGGSEGFGIMRIGNGSDFTKIVHTLKSVPGSGVVTVTGTMTFEKA